MIFSLRKAEIEDLDLTYKIKRNALSEYLEQLWGWNDEAQYEFHQEHFNPNNFQLIEISNEPIGYLETTQKGNVLLLLNLMILKEFQGQRIGKIVLEDLLRQHFSIKLEVLKVNIRAIRFYESLGFTILEEMDDAFQMQICHYECSEAKNVNY